MTDANDDGKIADERYRLAEERYEDFRSGFLAGVLGSDSAAAYNPPKHLDWYKRGMMAGKSTFGLTVKRIGNELGLLPTQVEAPADEPYMTAYEQPFTPEHEAVVKVEPVKIGAPSYYEYKLGWSAAARGKPDKVRVPDWYWRGFDDGKAALRENWKRIIDRVRSPT